MEPNTNNKILSRMEEAYQASKSIVEYGLPTKIGFWDEKLGLMREKMALIQKKRGKYETLTIRKNIMFENLHKQKRLHEPNPYIHYGDPIQISTDELQTSILNIKPAVLSSIITEKDIDSTLNLCHGCPVVASFRKEPCARNVLTIREPKTNITGERVTYGKDVYICMHESAPDRTLYIQALVPTIEGFGGANEHYPLRLCECPDRYCKFKIINFNPNLRDVSVGDDVPSNTRICIAHTVSNRFLVTEKKCMPTLFGTEMEVSCYIYKDNNKESPVNYWELTIEKQKTLKKKDE